MLCQNIPFSGVEAAAAISVTGSGKMTAVSLRPRYSLIFSSSSWPLVSTFLELSLRWLWLSSGLIWGVGRAGDRLSGALSAASGGDGGGDGTGLVIARGAVGSVKAGRSSSPNSSTSTETTRKSIVEVNENSSILNNISTTEKIMFWIFICWHYKILHTVLPLKICIPHKKCS